MHFDLKSFKMFKLCFSLIFVAILQHVQCRPADVLAKSTATDRLHLFVANTSSSNNYHLGPIMSRINNFEDEINADLRALVPFFNFMFNTDDDSEETEEDDNCADQMIIELVPDHIETKDNSKSREEFEDDISGTEEPSQNQDPKGPENSPIDEETKLNKEKLDEPWNEDIPDSEEEKELNTEDAESTESIKKSNLLKSDVENSEKSSASDPDSDNLNPDEEPNAGDINPTVDQV